MNRVQDNNGVFEVIPTEGDQRQQQLVERYRQRREAQTRAVTLPDRPQRLPADERSWWGGERESLALTKHHEAMDRVHHSMREAHYTQQAMTALEYTGFNSGLRTVAAEESDLLQTTPNSVAAEFAQELLIDSSQRIRLGITAIQEEFLGKALRDH